MGKVNNIAKIAKKQRNILRPVIEQPVVSFGIGIVSSQEIDQINILNASFLAMHRAIEQLSPVPQHLLIDG